GWNGFSRNASQPAWAASSRGLGTTLAVSATINGRGSRRLAANSSPLPSGRRTSRSRTSKRLVSIALRPSAMVGASTSSASRRRTSSARASVARTSARFSASSSMRSSRTGPSGIGGEPCPRGRTDRSGKQAAQRATGVRSLFTEPDHLAVQPLLLSRCQLVTGQHQDRRGRGRLARLELGDHLESVDLWHQQVADHQVEAALPGSLQPFSSAIRRDQPRSGWLEHVPQALERRWIVVDRQDARRHHLRKWQATVERAKQRVPVNWLEEVVRGTQCDPELALVDDGDDHHRDLSQFRIALELTEHLPAIHVMQENVEQDCPRSMLLCGRVALHASACANEPMLRRGQVVRDEIDGMSIVLDEEYGVAADGSHVRLDRRRGQQL